jgi:hypothetical protein
MVGRLHLATPHCLGMPEGYSKVVGGIKTALGQPGYMAIPTSGVAPTKVCTKSKYEGSTRFGRVNTPDETRDSSRPGAK